MFRRPPLVCQVCSCSGLVMTSPSESSTPRAQRRKPPQPRPSIGPGPTIPLRNPQRVRPRRLRCEVVGVGPRSRRYAIQHRCPQRCPDGNQESITTPPPPQSVRHLTSTSPTHPIPTPRLRVRGTARRRPHPRPPGHPGRTPGSQVSVRLRRPPHPEHQHDRRLFARGAVSVRTHPWTTRCTAPLATRRCAPSA